MRHEYSNLKIFAQGGDAIKAAEILRGEIESRTGAMPQMTDSEKADISLIADPNGLRDGYKIEQSGSRLVFRARGIRGLIFAIGMFLRKSEVSGEKITLIQDIGGEYKPDKRIRGHQLGYRTTPNSYDAWDLEDYRRYYLDLMFFGCNTVEHIPYDGLGAQQNRLMKYDPQDFLVEASRIADEYDLDVSLWYPNDRENLEDAEKRRRRVFERTPRINVMFPPGGDPGDYDADLARWISLGASPRGGIGLDRCARADAWLQGQAFVTPANVQAVVHPVLRHRLQLSSDAVADGVNADQVLDRLLAKVALPA